MLKKIIGTIQPPIKNGPQQWPFDNGDVAYTYGGQLVVIPAPRGGVTPPPPPPQQFPPLVNPLFEEGTTGWVGYRMGGPMSELLLEVRDTTVPGIDPLSVYTGTKALMLSGYSRCWLGGIYQTLVNVPIGAHVRVGAWIMTYGSENPGCRNVVVIVEKVDGQDNAQ